MGSDSIYLEVAAGVTVFVLAGRYFEARAKSKAGSALRALAALSAKSVSVLLPDDTEMIIPADELKEQQRFAVRPGETIAADGLVVDGSAAIDMSAMTGEATPIRVHPGGSVIGGTVVLDGWSSKPPRSAPTPDSPEWSDWWRRRRRRRPTRSDWRTASPRSSFRWCSRSPALPPRAGYWPARTPTGPSRPLWRCW
jgi:cation-transporting P-type ATPase A/B